MSDEKREYFYLTQPVLLDGHTLGVVWDRTAPSQPEGGYILQQETYTIKLHSGGFATKVSWKRLTFYQHKEMCECGVWAIGGLGNTHSRWCRLYKGD